MPGGRPRKAVKPEKLQLSLRPPLMRAIEAAALAQGVERTEAAVQALERAFQVRPEARKKA